MNTFFNRDTSWLSFNYRVLLEAANENVPLVERLKFLAIFSSNMDEFYRVRMPEITTDNNSSAEDEFTYKTIYDTIQNYLEVFGSILTEQLLPAFEKVNIVILYNKPIPSILNAEIENVFFIDILPFINCVKLEQNSNFYVENNKLYKCLVTQLNNEKIYWLLNIPSDNVSRFIKIEESEKSYILFIDDIIAKYSSILVPNTHTVKDSFNIKITRNGALEIEGAIDDHLLEKMEHKIIEREFGFASRFLYDSCASLEDVNHIKKLLQLDQTLATAGGRYHNLKDFFAIPISNKTLLYDNWQPILYNFENPTSSLLDHILQQDVLIHPPYNDYGTVIRFFSEAATNPNVEEIYTTLYRVASTSKIANALVTAAKNGKRVTVLVEIKARFDEANNVAWSKKLEKAGARVIFSEPNLKVHAKVALIKKRNLNNRADYIGMYATGNLNEGTAKLYTDHILMTSNTEMAEDLENLFLTLQMQKPKELLPSWQPKQLLIAQYNLQTTFLQLIDDEINNAKKGIAASIIIKMNNLEEKVLINKLYEASNAGVQIKLIIRSICCCVPNVTKMSDNITITRIVDKYLEHGRIFIFNNNGNEKIYLGSSDWMNRNIYKRIEVCFPLYNLTLKKQITDIIKLQLADNTQAVFISKTLENVFKKSVENNIETRSQQAIYNYVAQLNTF